MKTKALLLFAGLFGLCTISAALGAEASLLKGVWKSSGYGRIFEFGEKELDIFSVTKVSCAHWGSQSLDDFIPLIDRIDLSQAGKFSFFENGGITRYDMSQLKELQNDCVAARSKGLNTDPELNFEAFWNSFNENYAFFELHNVDWTGVYREYRPKITATTSNDDLYSILTEVILLMDDRHVSLKGDSYPPRYSGHPGTLARLLHKELPNGEEPTRENIGAAAKQIIGEHYLKASRKDAVDGLFTWGWAADEIGYFSVDSMSNYLAHQNGTLSDSHRLVDEVMDQIIQDLEGAVAIIVDVRWNGGGFDSNALQIAAHFTDRQQKAFTKNARLENTLTPVQQVFIPGDAVVRFTGPIVVLTGQDTLSAAEIFSLAMMAIPSVKHLGEPTSGALSDTLTVVLPNGWRLGLSNEIYQSIDGKVYEGVGIPVDMVVPATETATFESYIRGVMDEAILWLQDFQKDDNLGTGKGAR